MEDNKDEVGAAVRGEAVEDLEARHQVAVALGLGRDKRASFSWSYLLGCIQAAVSPRVVGVLTSVRAADAPSEPSEREKALEEAAMILESHSMEISSDFVKRGWLSGLVAEIRARAAVKSRAADALDSQPTETRIADLEAQLIECAALSIEWAGKAGEADGRAEKLRAAFHLNMLRAHPGKTHAEITAEIDRAIGVDSRASAAPVTENGWQPIETAPTVKGDYFFCSIAWGTDGEESTGEGLRWNGRWFVAAVFHALGQERKYEFREIEVKPTHWRHSPPAPQQEGSEAGNG